MDIYIPNKLVVGFQNRQGTFTGKLAYVIYKDDKGVLRQEKSWNSWRDKTIGTIELDNEPREGFVLNKGIQRSGYFGSGRSVIRVHDPREFEFEISVDNLIGILMHSDVSKRDIVEKCVFAWAGKNLMLLPVNSEEYEKAVEATRRMGTSFSAKTLEPGRTYSKKRGGQSLVYLGYFPWADFSFGYLTFKQVQKGKKHVFYNGNTFEDFAPAQLAECVDEVCYPEYSNLVEKFLKSGHTLKVSGYTLVEPKMNEYLVFPEKDGGFMRIHGPRDSGYWDTDMLKRATRGTWHSDRGIVSDRPERLVYWQELSTPKSPEMQAMIQEIDEFFEAHTNSPEALLDLLKKQGWKSVELSFSK